VARIWTIARMTFIEARRNRVTWSLLFFCGVLVMTSFMFQELTIAGFDRVVRDVGLAAIHAFGVMLAIFLGVSVVTREIERRTVYSLLARPLGRAQYLIGKVLGVWITIIVSLSLMMCAFLIENALYGGPMAAVVFETFWLMLVELLVITSFSVLVSTFSSSVMAAFLSMSLFIIGHTSQDLYFFGRKSHVELVRKLGAACFFALPNLERLNLKTKASIMEGVPLHDVLLDSLYGFCFVMIFLVAAASIFGRRDLK
jgi:Cu-processing system permease protein